MDDTTPSMSTLFQQLGLDDSDEAIATFIKDGQLASDVNIVDAPYWSDAQRHFIGEQLGADAAWAIIADQLNEALHENSVKRQTGLD